MILKKKEYSAITKSNKNKFPDGFIYFIRCKNTNFFKLGVSKNPKRRICDLDSYLPFDLEILYLHFFKNVYEVEYKISNLLKNYKVRREWYNLDIKKAKEIMIILYNLNIEKDASEKNI